MGQDVDHERVGSVQPLEIVATPQAVSVKQPGVLHCLNNDCSLHGSDARRVIHQQLVGIATAGLFRQGDLEDLECSVTDCRCPVRLLSPEAGKAQDPQYYLHDPPFLGVQREHDTVIVCPAATLQQ